MTKATGKEQTLADRVEKLERTRDSEVAELYKRLNAVEDVAECGRVGHVYNILAHPFHLTGKSGRRDIDYLVTATRRCGRCDVQKEDRFDLRSRKDRKAFLAFLRG